MASIRAPINDASRVQQEALTAGDESFSNGKKRSLRLEHSNAVNSFAINKEVVSLDKRRQLQERSSAKGEKSNGTTAEKIFSFQQKIGSFWELSTPLLIDEDVVVGVETLDDRGPSMICVSR